MPETYCSCCGVAKSDFNEKGHNKECIWWDIELHRLAKEWLTDESDINWKDRYNLIVKFLLDENYYLDKNYKDLLANKSKIYNEPILVDTINKLIEHFGKPPTDEEIELNSFLLHQKLENQDRCGIVRMEDK